MNSRGGIDLYRRGTGKEQPGSRKVAAGTVTLLFVSGLVLRMVLAQAFGGLDRVYQDDEVTYIRVAMSVVEGLGFTNDRGEPSSYRTPGLPLLLALLINVIGTSSTVAVRVFMCIIDSFLIPACYLLGRAASGSRRIGLTVAAIAVVFPTWVIPAGAVLSDVASAILVVLVAWAAIEGYRRKSILWIAISGALCGLAALTRPVSVAYLPGISLWLLIAGSTWRRSLLGVAAFWITAASMLAPWTIRNTLVHGVFVLVSTQGGTELYKSNNPGATGILYLDQTHFQTSLKERYSEREYPNEAVRSAHYQADAISFIRSDPIRFAELCFVRLTQLWRLYSPRVPLVNSLVIVATFGVALPFFLFQVGRNAWGIGPDILLVSIILCHTLVHIVFTSILRYRIPIEPLVVVMAVEGFYALVGVLRSHRTVTQTVSPGIV